MLRVIGAGFGRTGTASLKSALEDLGFGPCYHMFEVANNLDHAEQWIKAGRGEPVDWHAVFANYQSSTDWPACTFWDRHLEAFPDAKVLLTVRDPDAWYDSVINTIYASRADNPRLLEVEGISAEILAKRESRRDRAAMIDQIIWKGTFGGRFADRASAIAIFNEHIANVKRSAPADRLLSFDVKQGWGPLCAFLGVAVPDKPFPHVNDSASIREQFARAGLI